MIAISPRGRQVPGGDCLVPRLLFGIYCDMFDHITQIEISSSYNWEYVTERQ